MKIVNKELGLLLGEVGFSFSVVKHNLYAWKFHNFSDEYLYSSIDNAIEAAAEHAGQLMKDAGICNIEKWRELILEDKATLLRQLARCWTCPQPQQGSAFF